MSANLYRGAVRGLLLRRLHGYIKSTEMFREMAKVQQQYQVSNADAQRVVAELVREPASSGGAA